MYLFGQALTQDIHFLHHMEHDIPVQVYLGATHADIGYVSGISRHFIRIGPVYYNRGIYRFVSRPGY
ncbi:hypothetical protein D3C75_1092460 [compost metagenome]